MWIKRPFFKYATAILLILLIIFFFGKIDYFVWPFKKFIATIFFPILISGVIYYLMRPFVTFFSKYISKNWSILIVYLLFIGAGYLFVLFTGTPIAQQVQQLSDQFPNKVEKISNVSHNMVKHNSFGNSSLRMIEEKASSLSNSFFHHVEQNITNILSTITSIATVLAVVPFIVFYFLRDDEKLKPALLKNLPVEHVEAGNLILVDIDKTLSAYIIGQCIIALSDGILLYIGFCIIGLNNSLLLAIFAMCMTIVPFIGLVIGMVPAVLVALLQSPFMVLKVVLVVIVAQQIDGNLVTPRVMGKKLDIHPLTVIFILLISGAIYGFVGIIIAIPLYSVVKVTLKNVIRFYKLRRSENM
ncbi:AI-2E family transporter [Neobacillus sp. NPDC093127]|uniref:AI-2E family transporter n=1 Tax=Neobacillus sp. NPDC093127 TaxID=3364296 RepID=UPI0037F3813D